MQLGNRKIQSTGKSCSVWISCSLDTFYFKKFQIFHDSRICASGLRDSGTRKTRNRYFFWNRSLFHNKPRDSSKPPTVGRQDCGCRKKLFQRKNYWKYSFYSFAFKGILQRMHVFFLHREKKHLRESSNTFSSLCRYQLKLIAMVLPDQSLLKMTHGH